MIFRLLALFFFSLGFNSYAQIDGVEVTYTHNPDNSCDFYYKKSAPGTYHLVIKFRSIRNTEKYFFEGNVKDDSGFLFHLKPQKPEKKIKFICEPYYVKGNPKPDIDKDFKYLLPFKKGKTIAVSTTMSLMSNLTEGNNNYGSYMTFSSSPQSESIHAMRKGVVIDVVNSYDFDPKSFDIFHEKRNSIIIEHEDGTLASYQGFKKDAILVKIGQTVLPTDCLGSLEKSVDNWYHLFFEIYYDAYMEDVFPDKKEDLKQRISKELNSFFHTNKGLVALHDKLYDSQDYVVETPEAIIRQEFTKEELNEKGKLLNNQTLKSN